ncbi:MAG TPA: vanadium-dependent haloperoxidase [Gemmatimonadaceae bacterium]|nr:vanadium-dependent haloperoxidase [Gemmatimonadaceae bacterium]
MKSLATLAASVAILSACSDPPTEVAVNGEISNPSISSSSQAVYGTSSARWNRKAIALFRARGGNAGRINAYVSLAQYRAALAADDAKHGHTRPSPAGAVAAASAVVLKQFFSLDINAIDAELTAQRNSDPFGSEHNKDFAAGETIGQAIGAAVLAFAATDNFGATSPGTPPVGAGYWVSSGSPIVRGGLGARPFFMTSGSELRLGPPPAYGSSDFLSALAEVRAFSDARTADQIATTQKWVPFSGVLFNGVATDLIDKYHTSEIEAARILAYANAAAFDAIIACFDTKFTYWFIRPTQADAGITLATGLPNHPSYPSAHSCETGAFEGVLDNAFPSERAYLASVAQEASMSRVIGGLHYRFDGDGGLAIGHAAARIALQRRGLE